MQVTWDENTLNTLRKVFKLRYLEGGFQKLQFDSGELNVHVNYIWVVVIHEYRELVLAGIDIAPSERENFPGLHQNVMWLQSSKSEKSYWTTPTYPISLGVDEIDPVAENLKSVNLLPTLLHIGLDLPDERSYEVYTATPFGASYFKHSGAPQSQNMKNLWLAIETKIRALAPVRNDEINRCLDFLRIIR